MMITLLGTGHVFRIAEPVSFIVKNIWPDAVLVELDTTRYGVLMSPEGIGDIENQPKEYRKMAKYQRKVAEENESRVGAEFIAAIETGRTIGAAIEFIDKDAAQVMRETMEEMPFFEKFRFRFGSIRDVFSRKKNADNAVKEFGDNEEGYMNSIRKRFPTLVRKLIDERDVHMVAKIKEASGKYGNIVVVIGDGHVEGIAKLLEGETIRKIRLKTLMDPERMNALRSELWTGMPEEKE